MKPQKSYILKIAIFATGLSGIVAEYVLSTLATYFLGNSVFQWTMVVSLMLFAMGVGSYLSSKISKNLLEKFIVIEFILSLLTASSAMIVYLIAAHSIYTGILIYSLCFVIGMLIGLEIPMVTRINESYESLKENISAVLAYDYVGSLLGGVFFAFVGIPHLGMTYTPQVLGMVNLLVAVFLLFKLGHLLTPKSSAVLKRVAPLVVVFMISGFFVAKPILLFGEQSRYKEKVVYQERSKYQKIVITQWKNHHWLFLNGNEQLSTLDEWMYHEPLVHPAMSWNPAAEKVLILGGGDGCAARELLKYKTLKAITVVDLDPAVVKLARTHPLLKRLNQGGFENEKVQVIHDDGFRFLENTDDRYDLIIVDLPDPKTVELARLYSKQFYELVTAHLKTQGVVVTQAGSPQYAYKAFVCIEKTMNTSGLVTIPLHNNILTLGEWGFVMGFKTDVGLDEIKTRLKKHPYPVGTKWLNLEAMNGMMSFGKPPLDTSKIEINTTINPVVQQYYLNGAWDLY